VEDFNEDHIDEDGFVVQIYMFEPEPPTESPNSSENEDVSDDDLNLTTLISMTVITPVWEIYISN
jgi:hypothetical protein